MTILAALPSFELLNADDSVALECLPLTAAEIARVTGFNIYKYRLAMKPGTTFDVTISVQDAPDDKPRFSNRQSFTSDGDGETVGLLLSFLARDDTMRGVLLSQDDEITYRVDCRNCTQTGFATNVSLPLKKIPGTRKTVITMTRERSRDLSEENEICLIAILASEEGKPVSVQESFPRAKISVNLTE